MKWLKYTPHIPFPFELSEGKTLYVQCRNDVCLVQVPDELVPLALSKKSGCCGGETRSFVPAPQDEIDRFLA